MRVAYICADPGVPVFGLKGCSVHVQEIIRALIQAGHQVEVFTPRLGGKAPPDLTLSLTKLPSLPRGDLALREQAAMSLNLDLRFALERSAPFDLVFERYSLWSFSGIEYAQAHGIPSILEVNAPLIEEQAAHRGLVHRQQAKQIAQRVFRAATSIAAVSEGVANYLKQYQPQHQVQVIPNGVNPDRFPANIIPTFPSSAFTIGFVGSMKPWHGLSTLVEAFADCQERVQSVRLLIVGDGPERSSIEAQLTDRNLRHLAHFTGNVPPTTVPGLLASMDVAVAPYPNHPNFYFSPLKVYEYMAAGRPIIASRIGQLCHVIQDGRNGLLYEAGDSTELANHLMQLYYQPALRSQLGVTARATVLQNHTWQHVVQKLLRLPRQTVQHRQIHPLEVSA
jgi:glycosyltransferase involved in cell wall biosynthesis